MTMSASFTASALIVAPTVVNSESGRPALTPAPGSTATSNPSALNFFTVSGEAATRGSAGSISLATAIFMKPPAAQDARANLWDDGSEVLCDRARPRARQATHSGEEYSHHYDDEGDGGAAVFDQVDEAEIGRLVRRVIVAVGGRVCDF